jgi:hypothetical protein
MGLYHPVLLKAGGWHYCCTNDVGTFPIGYCCFAKSLASMFVPWSEAADSVKWSYQTQVAYERWLAATLPYRVKYHSWGHPTEAQALRCYHEFLIDQKIEYFVNRNQQERCRECGEWTINRGNIRGEYFSPIALCDLHKEKEFVAKYIFTRETQTESA